MNVFCVTDYFLPGFRGGGPITTISNMRHQLKKEVSLAVFTRDRDLADTQPYAGISPNTWTETAEGPVYYADIKSFGPQGFWRALSLRAFDVVYFNSFFSTRGSILLHAALKLKAPDIPVLIAPRGEFSPGALSLKKTKKAAFIRTARISGLYRDVFWHASTTYEANDIQEQFPCAAGRIFVAPDPVVVDLIGQMPDAPPKRPGAVRLAFISRISPMKNLLGLLEILADVTAPVSLDIFGPVEDQEYWSRCEAAIAQLPGHIAVRAQGALAPNDVSATFASHDLFAFPTFGENFGHVIFEALRAGTPVLISDKTPWQADEGGAIRVLDLDDRDGWKREIERTAACTHAQQQQLRRNALDFATRYLSKDPSRQANKEMFHTVRERSLRTHAKSNQFFQRRD